MSRLRSGPVEGGRYRAEAPEVTSIKSAGRGTDLAARGLGGEDPGLAPRGARAPAASSGAFEQSRLASRSAGGPGGVPGTDADEQMLRTVRELIERVSATGAMSPVERAILVGAQATFGELADLCGRLLEPSTNDQTLAASAAPDGPDRRGVLERPIGPEDLATVSRGRSATAPTASPKPRRRTRKPR